MIALAAALTEAAQGSGAGQASSVPATRFGNLQELIFANCSYGPRKASSHAECMQAVYEKGPAPIYEPGQYFMCAPGVPHKPHLDVRPCALGRCARWRCALCRCALGRCALCRCALGYWL